MAREVKIGIKVEADTTKAEAGLRAIGEKAQGLGKTAGKLAPVMNLAAGSMGSLGGAGAQAAGQISGLLSTIGEGGALGIGIVALGAVLAGGKAALDAWTFSERQAADESRQFADILSGQLAKSMADANSRLRSATEALNAYGRDALSEQISQEKARTENLRKNIPSMQHETYLLERRIGILRRSGQAESEESKDLIEKKKTLDEIIAAKTRDLSVSAAALDALSEHQMMIALDAESQRNATSAIESNAAAEAMALNASKRAWEEYKVARRSTSDDLKRSMDDEIRQQNLVLDGEKRSLDARISNFQNFSNRRIALIQAQSDADVLAAQQADARIEAEVAAQRQLAQTVIGVAGDIAMSLTQKHREMTADERATALAQMAIKLAVGLASAIAAGAGVAWPANIGAIASGVAAVGAAFAQIASFANGGFVTGGRRGRDSVPAMLMPGEYVMNNREVANGAPSWAGGGTTINNFMWQPDSVGMARMTRRQARAMRNLQKRGMLKLAPAGG